jgi:putative spermidine/putrescine transport system substrate-binding protein
MNGPFRRDCLELLSEKLAAGKISRRTFAQAGALLLATPAAMRATSGRADANQLVLVNWGGDALKAYDKAYGQPFRKETGIVVKEDGSGPTEGAITAQAKSGKVTWDLLDIDPFSAITLGAKGYLTPIDYAVVDKSKFRAGFGWPFAASTYFFSYVIAYDTQRYGANPPKTMADFFDVEKFPGKRSMYKWGVSSWEAALLADGVPREKLYPLDLARAEAKLKALKPHIASYWGGGAESQTVLLNGEAAMAIIWSTRGKLIEEASNGQIKFVWDDGLLSPGALGIMKNNPGGAANANKFIASAQDPKRQLVMFDMLGQGPANPAADSLIPADQQRYNCVAPDNMAKQIPLDMNWYAANYSAALDRYLAMISA